MQAFPIFILIALIGFASLALIIWAIVDIARAEFPENYKLIWILVVLLGGIIGLVIYLAMGRSQKITEDSHRHKYVPPGKNPFDQQ